MTSALNLDRENIQFIKDHAVAFASGATMGGLISESLPGAIACGALHAISLSNARFSTHALAAVLFAGVKFVSSSLVNRDLTVFTPLMIAFFNKGAAKSTMALSALSFAYKTGTISFLCSYSFELVSSQTINNQYARPLWQWCSGKIKMICQYRLGKVACFLPTYYSLLEAPQFAGKIFYGLYKLQKHQVAIVGIAKRLLFFEVGLMGIAIASVEMMQYLTANRFGDASHILPVLFLVGILRHKYVLFEQERRRRNNGSRFLPLHHPIEINREIRTVLARDITTAIRLGREADDAIEIWERTREATETDAAQGAEVPEPSHVAQTETFPAGALLTEEATPEPSFPFASINARSSITPEAAQVLRHLFHVTRQRDASTDQEQFRVIQANLVRRLYTLLLRNDSQDGEAASE